MQLCFVIMLCQPATFVTICLIDPLQIEPFHSFLLEDACMYPDLFIKRKYHLHSSYSHTALSLTSSGISKTSSSFALSQLKVSAPFSSTNKQK